MTIVGMCKICGRSIETKCMSIKIDDEPNLVHFDCWENAVSVFDESGYKIIIDSEETKEDIIEMLEVWKDNFEIPSNANKEYHEGKLNTIVSIMNIIEYDNVRDMIDKLKLSKLRKRVGRKANKHGFSIYTFPQDVYEEAYELKRDGEEKGVVFRGENEKECLEKIDEWLSRRKKFLGDLDNEEIEVICQSLDLMIHKYPGITSIERELLKKIKKKSEIGEEK